MTITAFSTMDAIMLAPVESFISTGSGALMNHIKGPVKTATTLYIVLYGYLVLKGSIQEPAMDFVFKCMKIVIITLLATSAADYNAYVSTFFFHTLPEELGSALNTPQVPGNPFDTIMSTALDKALALWDGAAWGASMILDAILVGSIMATAAFVSIVGYIVSIYAKMALALLLVLGPVFIALALFDGTRRFTEGWLGQVANFVILQILVVTLGSLLLDTLIELINGLNKETDAATAAITYAAYTLCAAYIFFQLPMIASALAAGGAMLTFGGGRSRVGGSPDGGGSHGAEAVAPAGQSGTIPASGRSQFLTKRAIGRAVYWAGRGTSRMGRNIHN